MPSMVTFMSNIPVIFVTFRSHRFEEDLAAKVISSLGASDIVNRVMISCCASMAWSLQPAAQRFRCGCWDYWIYLSTFSKFVPSLTWLPCLSSSVPLGLLFELSPTLPSSLPAPCCTIWIVSIAVGCATNWCPFRLKQYDIQCGKSRYKYSYFCLVYDDHHHHHSNSHHYDLHQGVPNCSTTGEVHASRCTGPVGSRMIFGSSVRSAKNLFVICIAYYLTYLPVVVNLVLWGNGILLPEAVRFAVL